LISITYNFSDFEDQADMCEIVRAMISAGVIQGAKLEELSESAVEGIDCPGQGDEGQSEICAVSGGSPAQKYAWYILLEGVAITANERPKFEMDPKSKQKLISKKNKK
jgi:hypothetical protein